MDFQVTWGTTDGSEGVSSDDPASDLTHEKGSYSPSIGEIDPDTLSFLDECASIAGTMVTAIDNNAGKRYGVVISGHITTGVEQATASIQVMSN